MISNRLSDLYAPPSELALAKQLDHIDAHAAHFIAQSPFVVISTCGAQGRCDASPRGDAPGFVVVAGPSLLHLPDRPGNNRIDSLHNIAVNPCVGLLFFVPGVLETLRVNGRARVSDDQELLASMAVDGRLPRSALEVCVEEVYFHCGKALKRSRLWEQADPARAQSIPSLGRILADQTGKISAQDADVRVRHAYETNLY